MARSKKLKVFGANVFFHRGKQLRTIVAAYSQKEAAEKAGVSLYDIRTWWCETGNPLELETALPNPGILFYQIPQKRGELGINKNAYKPFPYDEEDFK
jgi:hypothetical protein